MAEYNIFRRGVQTRHSQRLTFVYSIMAKDAVDAMLKFCGQKSNCTFVAMPATWKGNQSHIIANMNYA